MNVPEANFDLKVFKINRNYYELKNMDFFEMIEVMKKNHLNSLRSRFKGINIKILDPKLTYEEDDIFKYYLYCFRQPKEKYYWKIFLPETLTENHNFEIVEFSFVLFIGYKDELYCVISGSGMNVIKKYIHSTFGIEIYRRLAKPEEDLITEIERRSISNNISTKKEVFSYNQNILSTLEYSDVITKMKIKVRDELRLNEFKKYNLNQNLSLLEVGSYFNLRKKMSFEMLKSLIVDLHTIYKRRTPQRLTLFSKIDDEDLIYDLDKCLINMLVDHVKMEDDKENNNIINNVVELVHPSKLEKFYECNHFILRFKKAKHFKDKIVKSRDELFSEAIKHIYESLNDVTDDDEIKQKIFNLQIRGKLQSKEGKDATFAYFLNHINTEIDFENKKYFRIDNQWYYIENEFLEKMNEDAQKYYNKYKLSCNFMHKWDGSLNEGLYNESYHGIKGFYVLDKVIGDNIELCDILHISESRDVYFIHIKDGFDAKMRDLYNQIVLSAKRLFNDLKSDGGNGYLKKVIENYNKKNTSNKIKIEDLRKLLSDYTKINFVMGFRSKQRNKLCPIEKIKKSQSNIAKYSIVQVVKEITQLDYNVKLIDLSELE
ncbi:hypothetical protein EQP59_08370 [Ornithobacterium rhinotracheale]|uniref:Sporadically distributed protein, TIGR04141 family n=1 Tax=Ornithobacterium rhinotracheale TaxID=28251 RepID=A0A3R5XUB6_ORNRH|nr:DUF6119 family protein [Ornithobacterium rhinotracheale]QAR31352.1 hypothetical protein EQP59_08370 [Ornithobacterium rhinotracheale]